MQSFIKYPLIQNVGIINCVPNEEQIEKPKYFKKKIVYERKDGLHSK